MNSKEHWLTVGQHVLAGVGVAAFVYGCWLIYRPAGFLVGGLLLLVISLLWDRERRPRV